MWNFPSLLQWKDREGVIHSTPETSTSSSSQPSSHLAEHSSWGSYSERAVSDSLTAKAQPP